MSRGFVKEGDQEEIPMVLPRAFLPKGIPNYVTEEGLELLNEEMSTLKKEWTDAGGNYVTKNYLDAKMRLLSERINSAVLIDINKSNPDIVSFGLYVKYNDKVIRIVGVDEADTSKGLISFISPIAKALIGRRKGERFEIKIPKGTEIIEIQDISTRLIPNDNKICVYKKTNIQEKTRNTDSKTIGSPLSKKSSHSDLQIESNKTKVTDIQIQRKSDSNKVFIPENNPTEFLPLINEQGNIIGRALLCEIHDGNKILHPAVHLLIYNSSNIITAKYWWHVAFGETAEKTLKRKIKEITSDNIKPKFKKQYIRDTKTEKELVSVYITIHDDEILASPDDKHYEMIFEKD